MDKKFTVSYGVTTFSDMIMIGEFDVCGINSLDEIQRDSLSLVIQDINKDLDEEDEDFVAIKKININIIEHNDSEDI